MRDVEEENVCCSTYVVVCSREKKRRREMREEMRDEMRKRTYVVLRSTYVVLRRCCYLMVNSMFR